MNGIVTDSTGPGDSNDDPSPVAMNATGFSLPLHRPVSEITSHSVIGEMLTDASSLGSK